MNKEKTKEEFEMNLSSSKKTLALAGALCGIVAVILALKGNPANMAICIACFIRDTAGAEDDPLPLEDVVLEDSSRCPFLLARLDAPCAAIKKPRSASAAPATTSPAPATATGAVTPPETLTATTADP